MGQLGHGTDTLRAKNQGTLFLFICDASLSDINQWLAPLEKTVDFDRSDQKHLVCNIKK